MNHVSALKNALTIFINATEEDIMGRYIIKRILMMIPVLILVSFVVFFTMNLARGDEVDAKYGSELTVEEKDEIREELGLNDPLLVRYFRYMWKMLHGDMGKSFVTNEPVSEAYFRRLPETLKLAAFSAVFSVIVAVPLGILAAVHQNTWLDGCCTTLGLIGVSMPSFWWGLLLILLFSNELHWLPSFGNLEGFKSIILPGITLGSIGCAIIMRTTRSSMLEVMRQDYLRTARAKGVSERKVIWRHALKNAAVPIITVIGTQLSASLGGAVLTETVFSWPGIGFMTFQAIGARDFDTATGSIILTTFLSSIIILIMDIIYAFINPQIKARYTKK